MNLMQKLTAIALLTVSGFAVAAQPAPAARSPVVAPHERVQVRHDEHRIARDKQALKHNRHPLKRAQHAPKLRRAAYIRHGMHAQRVSLHHHRAQHRHDVRKLHRG